jgi:hypothetical protein
LTAAIRSRECGNELLIRSDNLDINTSVVGNDKGRLSAVKEIESGLADVVLLSVRPFKNPIGPRRSRRLLRRCLPN